MALNIQQIIDDNPSALGLAIIITNDYIENPLKPDLHGAKKDGEEMEKSFRSLRFAVIHKHNASLTFTMSILHKAANDIHYLPSYRRLAFVFAGHGEENGCLFTNDGNSIQINTILNKLSPSSSKPASSSPLGHMVRLFFIDACRGDRNDLGMMVSPRGGKSTEPLRIPSTVTNVYIAYSTVSGFQSYEVKDQGGLWMQCVARKLMTVNDDISVVMTEVNKELHKKFQDPKYTIMMNPESILRLTERVNLLEEAAKRPEPSHLESEDATPQLHSIPTQTLPGITEQTSSLHSTWTQCSTDVTDKDVVKQKYPVIAAKFTNSPVVTPQIGACRIQSTPPKLPSLEQILVGRVATNRDIRKHRDLLNQYKMKGKLKSFEFDTNEQYDENRKCPVFHSTVLCTLSYGDGKQIKGDSKMYYPGKKAISEDIAAEDAVAQLTAIFDLTCEQIEHSSLSSLELPRNDQPSKSTTSLSTMDGVHNQSTTSFIQCVISTTASLPPMSTESTNSVSPKEKVYKQKLNNYIQHQLRESLPQYTTESVGTSYQCVIVHRLFGSIQGGIFPTKKEAENSAAWRVWYKINRN